MSFVFTASLPERPRGFVQVQPDIAPKIGGLPTIRVDFTPKHRFARIVAPYRHAVPRDRSRNMCGRFTRASSREVLAEEFGVTTFVNVDLRPRYNIAPSQIVEAVIGNGAERRLGPMKWGFASSMDSTLAPTNARAETVATSALFREAFQRRRCMIVADGFYEWRKDGSRKTPYFIRLRSGRPFGFAGIWSSHRTAVGGRSATCAIVTCVPNELMAPIHDWMPLILPAGARDRWLDAKARESDLRERLVPLLAEDLEAYPVSTLVNSPRNDSPECVRPVAVAN